MSALVIKSWRLDRKPIDGSNNFVSIVGRQGGFISWVLSLLGIDPSTKIVVGLERIEFSSSSLSGTEYRLIPLEGVCSSYYGYYKPWKSAAFIVALFVWLGSITSHASVMAGFLLFAIGIGLGLVYYFLNRQLTLGFIEDSGVVNGIRFKRSVIENIDINEDQAKNVWSIPLTRVHGFLEIVVAAIVA